MEAAPGSQEAIREAAVLAKFTRRHREALELWARLDLDRGVMRSYKCLQLQLVSESLHMLGEHRRELKVARQPCSSEPSFFPVFSEVRALAALGRAEDMLEEVHEARRRFGNASYAFLLTLAAHELRAHGHDEQPVLARASAAWEENIEAWAPGDEVHVYWLRLAFAWTLLYQERFEEARVLVDEIREQVVQVERELEREHLADRRYYMFGSLNFLHSLLLARTGDRSEAFHILEQRQGYVNPTPSSRFLYHYQWESATLAGWLGERELAVRLYPDHLWPEYAPCRWIEEEPLRGYAPYEALRGPVD